MGLLVVYRLTGWLPTLIKDAGRTITVAANVTAMFQIGATIGAILIGWSMDRRHPSRLIGVAYLAGAVFITGFALVGALSGWLCKLVAAKKRFPRISKEQSPNNGQKAKVWGVIREVGGKRNITVMKPDRFKKLVDLQQCPIWCWTSPQTACEGA